MGDDLEVSSELREFIDRVVVPLLVERWLEKSVEIGAENGAAQPEELEAAA